MFCGKGGVVVLEPVSLEDAPVQLVLHAAKMALELLQALGLLLIFGDRQLQGLGSVPQLLLILLAVLLQSVGLVLQLLYLPVELVQFLVGAAHQFVLILGLLD